MSQNEMDAWRREVVAFLDANARLRTGIDDWSTSPIHASPEAEAEYFARCRSWQQTVFDAGFAGITWPVAFGGRGGAPWQQAIYREAEGRYDVSSGFVASTITLAGAALMTHASEAQQVRHLRPLLRADEVWCQLFSEPDAGSDLANLGTRAVSDGDEYVVDGQKVWTSGAHHADFGLLLARTDPRAPKHRGITFFILDMHSEGVDVRPLRQMTGAAHFNEVFFHSVRVPRSQVVGEVDHGWAVARTVLAAESAMVGGMQRFDAVAELTRLVRERGRANDPWIRQEFARVVTRERILGLMRERLRSEVLRGDRPSIDGSALKLLWSQAWSARAEFAMTLLGPAGGAGADEDAEYWQSQLLAKFGGAIGGGTDEIHRNHVGERVLGLPPEPRLDRDRPWRA
ncbi:MAG: acyl-CoA dehydrogenase family protein [Acidimicrobiia bacterium]